MSPLRLCLTFRGDLLTICRVIEARNMNKDVCNIFARELGCPRYASVGFICWNIVIQHSIKNVPADVAGNRDCQRNVQRGIKRGRVQKTFGVDPKAYIFKKSIHSEKRLQNGFSNTRICLGKFWEQLMKFWDTKIVFWNLCQKVYILRGGGSTPIWKKFTFYFIFCTLPKVDI